jgi:hypothetical protein
VKYAGAALLFFVLFLIAFGLAAPKHDPDPNEVHFGDFVTVNTDAVACSKFETYDQYRKLKLDDNHAPAVLAARSGCRILKMGTGGWYKDFGSYGAACFRPKGDPDCYWMQKYDLIKPIEDKPAHEISKPNAQSLKVINEPNAQFFRVADAFRA